MLPPSCTLSGQPSVVDEHASSQQLDRPPEAPQPEAESSPSPALNDISLSRRHMQMMTDLRSSMPFACCWLDPEDIKLVDHVPFSRGRFTEIWEATHDGRKVILKAYNNYTKRESYAAESVRVRFDHCPYLVVYR